MTVLGAGRGPSTLSAVTLSLDEMQYLVEKLEIDELPVVLDSMNQYDNEAAHDAALAEAGKSLAERELLDADDVHPELEARLRGLYIPHWVVALRLVVDGHVSRMCLAKGDALVVVALRGPNSYVLDEAEDDLPGPILSALGAAEPLELTGMRAPTEQLMPIFDDTGDAEATAGRLTEVCSPAHDAAAIGSAMVECYSHAEVVGVEYRDGGERNVMDNHIAIFNTRGGRFIATASRADDGTKWSSFSSGTTARIRTALQDIINSLPHREEFPHSQPSARTRSDY